MAISSSLPILFLTTIIVSTISVSHVSASSMNMNINFAGRWKISGDKEHVVPVLKFRAQNCYKRTQNCCYRYYSCGKHCKKNLCTQVPECSLYQKGKCKRYRTIKVCKARCYHKMCPRYECAPLKTLATGRYQPPKPYKSVVSKGDKYKH